MKGARIRVAALAATLAVVLSAGAVAAHEFTAAILVAGDDGEARLADAVRGMLMAADERDGHLDETSDGHLGGVDVQVLPLPEAAAGRVEGLWGTPIIPPDVVVVMGSEAEARAALAAFGWDSIVLAPGTLPTGWAEGSFATRYRSAYGTEPTDAAAEGYNASRRLDQAIRPRGGIEPRSGVEAALADSAGGIDW